MGQKIMGDRKGVESNAKSSANLIGREDVPLEHCGSTTTMNPGQWNDPGSHVRYCERPSERRYFLQIQRPRRHPKDLSHQSARCQ